jgi:antitoxin component of RelBE/YafQ-DinJ toxin-antitoxin module
VTVPEPGGKRLLTFRLDAEKRQRLRARLARDGTTMSAVITGGLRQYVQQHSQQQPRQPHAPRPPGSAPQAAGSAAVQAGARPEAAGMAQLPEAGGRAQPPEAGGRPQLPEAGGTAQLPEAGGTAQLPEAGGTAQLPEAGGRPQLPGATAARLRELRASGRSGVLSASLTALHEAGWPLPALADALGISRQAVQVRIRRRVPSDAQRPAERDRGIDYAPPAPFARRRAASEGRKHLTIKIDHALRTAAHRAAAGQGRSLSQVVDSILERYLFGHGAQPPDTPGRDSAARRSR